MSVDVGSVDDDDIVMEESEEEDNDETEILEEDEVEDDSDAEQNRQNDGEGMNVEFSEYGEGKEEFVEGEEGDDIVEEEQGDSDDEERGDEEATTLLRATKKDVVRQLEKRTIDISDTDLLQRDGEEGLALDCGRLHSASNVLPRTEFESQHLIKACVQGLRREEERFTDLLREVDGQRDGTFINQFTC